MQEIDTEKRGSYDWGKYIIFFWSMVKYIDTQEIKPELWEPGKRKD